MIVHGTMINNNKKTKCFRNIKDLPEYEALKVMSAGTMQKVNCAACIKNYIPGIR